ncbi:DUF2283 domain-containing protein [Candidatus Bathyarchaeota archaeon]|nr:DUF2283 domain-containing protein [Candidatus Bathyarchaeota archaeon]
MAKVKYHPDMDVLVVYLEETAEDYIEDHGNITVLYREGKPIGFEVWQASKLLTAIKIAKP